MSGEGVIDLTRDRGMIRALYAPPKGVFSVVEVPKLPFAVLDGEGAPEQASVGMAVKVLYSAIDSIRREARRRAGKAFIEAPVEILYWADNQHDFTAGHREKWHWRVQITLPVWADASRLEESVVEMRQESGETPAPRWEMVCEGKCVQFLHVGATDNLPAVLTELYSTYLPQQGFEPSGPYHEIYLDDWNRATSTQCRIILRQPVLQTV